MGLIGETVDSIKSIKIRQLLTQAVTLGSFQYDWFKLQLCFRRLEYWIYSMIIEFRPQTKINSDWYDGDCCHNIWQKSLACDWFRYDRNVCIDNMEGVDVCDWHWIPSGGCSLRKHGTWLSESKSHAFRLFVTNLLVALAFRGSVFIDMPWSCYFNENGFSNQFEGNVTGGYIVLDHDQGAHSNRRDCCFQC